MSRRGEPDPLRTLKSVAAAEQVQPDATGQLQRRGLLQFAADPQSLGRRRDPVAVFDRRRVFASRERPSHRDQAVVFQNRRRLDISAGQRFVNPVVVPEKQVPAEFGPALDSRRPLAPIETDILLALPPDKAPIGGLERLGRCRQRQQQERQRQ